MTCGILSFKGIEQSPTYLQKMAELNILVYKYKTKVCQMGDCKWQQGGQSGVADCSGGS